MLGKRHYGNVLARAARRSPTLVWLLLIASPLLAGSTHSPPVNRHSRPNIVIIIADDLGWNDVGYHGSDIATPNLDRLAQEGVALEHFYSAPFCSATRMGLLTGRWPIRWGMMYAGISIWEPDGLPPQEETIAEQLAWEGYARRAFVGKWHVGHARRDLHPIRQGFSRFYGHYTGAIDYFTHVSTRGGEVDWHRDFEPLDEAGYATHLLTDEAVEFIQQTGDNRRPDPPFLLVLSYNAPHAPLQAPEDCVLRTQDPSKPLRARYASVVSCLDEGIGRVLDALDDAGIADDTIVWFLSDNGGALAYGASNEPLRGTKFTVYEGGIRVPSIVRWPRGGLDGGRVSNAHMGYIDVLPTLRRMVRARRPVYRPFDGVDVYDSLLGRPTESDRDWFSYRLVFSFVPEFMSIISGTWKLVRKGGFILMDPNFQTPAELYNIKDDPTESSDLAASHPDIVHDLLCRMYSFSGLRPSYALSGAGEQPDGWEAPERWGIPPDPVPVPKVDRSRNDFSVPQEPTAMAPGCP